MIRLHIINGNTFAAMTANIDSQARAAARPDTIIRTTQPTAGPLTIESYYDEYLAIPHILAELIQNEEASEESRRRSSVRALYRTGLPMRQSAYSTVSRSDSVDRQQTGLPIEPHPQVYSTVHKKAHSTPSPNRPMCAE